MEIANQSNKFRVKALLNYTAEDSGSGSILGDGVEGGHSLIKIAKSDRAGGRTDGVVVFFISIL